MLSRLIAITPAVFAFVLASAACSRHAVSSPQSSPTPPASTDPDSSERIAKEISSVRRIPILAPISATRLPQKEFQTKLKEITARNVEVGQREAELAFLYSFGFDAPSLGICSRRSLEVVREQVLGVYDPTTKRLFVKATDSKSSSHLESVGVLAHEVEHALQDQNFGMPLRREIKSLDEWLARKAIYEGDAELTRIMVDATRKRQNTLWRLHDEVSSQGPSFVVTPEYLTSIGLPPELAQASAFIREHMTFPYYAGLAFMEAIYRTGHTPLVDKVFKNPPISTEQILHVEKYVDGEQPIPVATPPPPPGYKVATYGRMGEMQTRLFLSDCVSVEQAVGASRGWGGDAYAVVSSPGKPYALLWSTIWDDERSAVAFESALTAVATCKNSVLSTWSDDAKTVAVTRGGKAVSFVRGVTENRTQIAESLLALAGTPPPHRPPLGDITIKGPSMGLETAAGRDGAISNGVYINETIGLTAPAPEGTIADFTGTNVVVRFGRNDGKYGASIAVNRTPFETSHVETAFRSLGFSIANSLGEIRVEESGELSLPIGSARFRQWTAADSKTKFRALASPMCKGKSVLIVVLVWKDVDGKRVLENWVSSLRWVTDSAFNYCNQPGDEK